MSELKITYRCCEADGEFGLWMRVNDDDELGPVRLEGPEAAELTDLFNRMTTLVQRLQKMQPPVKPQTPVRNRPSGVRTVLDEND